MKILMTAILLLLTPFVFAQENLDFLGQIQSLEATDYSSGGDEERTSLIKTNYLKIHNFTYNYGSKILFKLNEGKTPNGHQLNLIHESLSAYIKLSSILNNLLHEIEPPRKILSEIESVMTIKELQWLELKALLLSNYKNTFKIFFGNKTLRRIIKDQMGRENYGLGNLKKVTEEILNRKFSSALQDSLDLFIEREQELLKLRSDKINSIIKNIKSTIAYKIRIEDGKLKELASDAGYLSSTRDSISRFFGKVTNALSFGFGSVAGNISWREGYLKDNQFAYKHIQRKLEPLDLLLEKEDLFLPTSQFLAIGAMLQFILAQKKS